MIKLENVYLKYPDFKIENFNLNIEKGEIIALTGNNASGKTTILNLIAGIVKQKKGKVLIDEEPINKSNKKIGIVFQNPDNQIIFNKVYDDIAFTLKNYKINKNDFDKLIDYALELVGMSEFKFKETFNLSAGQKQRIAIAGMLAIKPDIILFDEASVFLDMTTKQVLYNVFLKLKEQGVTVVFATNLIDEIVFADRVVLLNNGKVEAFESSEHMIKNLDIFRKLEIFVPLKLEIMNEFNILDDKFDNEILEKLTKKK